MTMTGLTSTDLMAAASRGCLREGAKSYVKQVNRQRRGASTAVQEARTFWPCSRNWPCGPTYL